VRVKGDDIVYTDKYSYLADENITLTLDELRKYLPRTPLKWREIQVIRKTYGLRTDIKTQREIAEYFKVHIATIGSDKKHALRKILRRKNEK